MQRLGIRSLTFEHAESDMLLGFKSKHVLHMPKPTCKRLKEDSLDAARTGFWRKQKEKIAYSNSVHKTNKDRLSHLN